MSRLLLALPLAFLLCSAPVHADSAKDRASAAKKAEKSGNWKKALEEWQAAYRLSPDADYLVGMGDAYAKLGDKGNARKQYEAYLADPLALDTSKVKGKIAGLDKPAAADLGDLDLSPTPAAKPAAKASAGADLGDLDLSAPAPSKKNAKKAKAGAADLGDLDLAPPSKPVAKASAADLGDLDLAPPTKPAAKAAASNDLGGLDLPPAAPAKPADKKAAAAAANSAAVADLGLDLGPTPSKTATTAKPPAGVAMAKKSGSDLDTLAAAPAVAPAAAPKTTASSAPASTGTKVAVATKPSAPPPPRPETKSAPAAAVSTEAPPDAGKTRVVAYVTAGAAVASLAVGGLYFSKASQDQAALTEKPHTGAEASALLEQQKTHKSVSFVAFSAGLALAVVATALFTF